MKCRQPAADMSGTLPMQAKIRSINTRRTRRACSIMNVGCCNAIRLRAAVHTLLGWRTGQDRNGQGNKRRCQLTTGLRHPWQAITAFHLALHSNMRAVQRDIYCLVPGALLVTAPPSAGTSARGSSVAA
jgi:hypothetical protein